MYHAMDMAVSSRKRIRKQLHSLHRHRKRVAVYRGSTTSSNAPAHLTHAASLPPGPRGHPAMLVRKRHPLKNSPIDPLNEFERPLLHRPSFVVRVAVDPRSTRNL